jgi:hypothetical protein
MSILTIFRLLRFEDGMKDLEIMGFQDVYGFTELR